jgi:hypothetical protein
LKLVAFELRLFQVSHEAANQSADLVGYAITPVELRLVDVLLVQCDIELGPDFTGRTFGDGQELVKLLGSITLKPFGNIDMMDTTAARTWLTNG